MSLGVAGNFLGINNNMATSYSALGNAVSCEQKTAKPLKKMQKNIHVQYIDIDAGGPLHSSIQIKSHTPAFSL
jgi:hypothetical protein